jgi:hypothetical protein
MLIEEPLNEGPNNLLSNIDGQEVREVFHGALIHGESYHQLCSTIEKVSGGRQNANWKE